MIEQLEAHAPYVVFIAGVIVLSAVMTVEAVREHRRKSHRRARQLELAGGHGGVR